MGRRPIGREAMTNAERQRQYINRLKSAVGNGPVSNETEYAARIAELEEDNISLREQLRKEPTQSSCDYSELAKKLEPSLEGMFDHLNCRHEAYRSLVSVSHWLHMLERHLVEYGIVPKSDRNQNAQSYQRKLKKKHEASNDKVWTEAIYEKGTLVEDGAKGYKCIVVEDLGPIEKTNRTIKLQVKKTGEIIERLRYQVYRVG